MPDNVSETAQDMYHRPPCNKHFGLCGIRPPLLLRQGGILWCAFCVEFTAVSGFVKW